MTDPTKHVSVFDGLPDAPSDNEREKMGKALVLRVCGPNGESYNGFRWPLTVGAEVVAPDWKPVAECGNGLHGWLYGAGDHTAADIRDGAKWLVVEVDESSIVMIGGKCKYPKGTVRFVGNMPDAAVYIREHEERAKSCAVIGAVVSVGDGESAVVGAFGTATAEDRGTATAGDRGTATAGYSGTATAGYRGTATAGDRGTATAGAFGTATAGAFGTATAGDRGTATAVDSGTATAGDSGTATAGDSGTATAGDRGTATAGDRGTATDGCSGTIVIEWYDRKADRYRRTVGYVGEQGIEANAAYRCDEAGKLVRA